MQSVHVAVDLTTGDADVGEEHQHDPHRQEQHELQSLLTVLQTPVVASRSAVVDPGKLGESGDPHGAAPPVVGGAVPNVHEEPSDRYREECRHGGGGDVSAEGSEGLSLDSTFTSRSAGQTPDGKPPPRAQHDVTTACVSQEGRLPRAEGPCFHVHRRKCAGCTCNCQPCFLCHAVITCRRSTRRGCAQYKLCIQRLLRFVGLASVVVYLGFAFHHSFGDEPSLRLLGVALVLLACWLRSRCREAKPVRYLKTLCAHLRVFGHRHSGPLWRVAVGVVTTGVVYFLVVEVALHKPQALLSAVGLLVYVIVFYVTSHDPAQVQWSTVGWGLALQFGWSLLVLRTRVGKTALVWVADRITGYLAYTDHGARYAFGDSFDDHHFAFKVVPSVIFFNATLSVLYYYGIVQMAVGVVAGFVTFILGTGPWESTHAAVSVFMGWAESMMVVRPVLDQLSRAELHTVMTNSFATVSGSTAAAYIRLSIPAKHLIAASFMSAPASLALSKLSYPDGLTRRVDQRAIPTLAADTGFIEAIVSGATGALLVTGYLLANVISFTCFAAVINDVIMWLGLRVGLELDRNFIQVMGSYVFWPFVFLMGVPTLECITVARMVGLKLLLNEMHALEDLGTVHVNRKLLQDHVEGNGTFAWTSAGDITLHGTNTTLHGGVLSPRSETIATFALCGFSDVTAYCVLLAALVSAAPSRKQELVELSMRAWVCGIAASFLSACMAGLTCPDSL